MNPFRALATSVLGQQVSWLAAKAITYKFCRLFHPELPEKQEPGSPPAPFPTPAQVVNCPYATLRTAGLSGRKAEYLIDISARFADGRLSAEKLMAMSDEEVYNSLIVVRGIGPWSVEMFQMCRWSVCLRQFVSLPGPSVVLRRSASEDCQPYFSFTCFGTDPTSCLQEIWGCKKA